MLQQRAVSQPTAKKSRQGRDSLVLVPAEEVPALWPHVEVYIQEANKFGGGRFSSHHWLMRILAGQADLFVATDLKCTAVCEPTVYPLRNIYVIILMGGEGGHDWDAMQEVFEQAAKARQCDGIEVYGRPGWRSILKGQGYQVAHHVWRKELE